jgi:hypothetical protein
MHEEAIRRVRLASLAQRRVRKAISCFQMTKIDLWHVPTCVFDLVTLNLSCASTGRVPAVAMHPGDHITERETV